MLINKKIKSLNSLNYSKKLAFDEYYTRYEDIHNEVINYKDQLRDKVVYCNCDNPYYSNFVKYFLDNFHFYGLKKLLATNYSSIISDVNFSLFNNEDNNYNSNLINFSKPYYFEYDGWLKDDGTTPTVNDINVKTLNGNGSYNSPECIDVLMKSDIVITNPPFSKLQDYLLFLIKSGKDFLIIGNIVSIAYSKIFNYFRCNYFNVGFTLPNKFIVNYNLFPNKTKIRKKDFFKIDNKLYCYFNVQSCWLTTLSVNKEPLKLTKSYYQNKDYYKFYDNYNALNVDSIKDIPYDYDGVIGVPVTICYYLNRNQFDVVGMACNLSKDVIDFISGYTYKHNFVNSDLGNYRSDAYIDGKYRFKRVLIKLKK